jgi:DNA-binding CsgD family transcriptional regulator
VTEQGRRIPGWLILEPDKVPDAWRDRVTEMAWVPLLPEEAEGILRDGSAEPATTDTEFLRQVAQGDAPGVIARRLSISTRSVHRRLARLRDSLGVASSAELAAELARRGF